MNDMENGSGFEPHNAARVGGLLHLDRELANDVMLRHERSWSQFESTLSGLSVVAVTIELLLSRIDWDLGGSAEDEARRAELLRLTGRWQQAHATCLQVAPLLGQADIVDGFIPPYSELRHAEREAVEALLEFACGLVAEGDREEKLPESP